MVKITLPNGTVIEGEPESVCAVLPVAPIWNIWGDAALAGDMGHHNHGLPPMTAARLAYQAAATQCAGTLKNTSTTLPVSCM